MRDAPIQLRSPSGLLIEASTGSSDGVLDQFYQYYDAAFVLENEKEDRAGFVECLTLSALLSDALPRERVRSLTQYGTSAPSTRAFK